MSRSTKSALARKHVAAPNLTVFDRLAGYIARDAHENNFSSRRGGGVMSGVPYVGEVIALYNNNPWIGEERETALLRTWMAKHGYVVRSERRHEGYTTGTVVTPPGSDIEEALSVLLSAWRDILVQVDRELDATGGAK